MASSKFTDSIVPVPGALIELAAARPNIVFCNLRSEQRPRISPAITDPRFDEFLRTVSTRTTVAIHYQLYGPELFTVIAALEPMRCWSFNENLPRLDFEKPTSWNQCPNLWGTFVIAIAQVEGIEPGEVIADPESQRFIEIIQKHGQVRSIPRFRSDVLLPIDLCEFQVFDKGQAVSQRVPASIDFHPGDRFEYEAGSNISGVAAVISVGERDGEGVLCQISKLS